MRQAMSRRRIMGSLIGLAALALLTLTSCGPDEPCAGVDCEFGECDSESGECVNLEECRVSDDCVPGYECNEEGTCEGLEECSNDDDCDTGVCDDDGVCVNPESCEENGDCLERSYCADDGTCQWDPCNEKDCVRGVCDRGRDRCVSADSCTEEDEELDCIAGEKCADGTCMPEDDFCEELDCERGECSFSEGGCVDADDCEGDDDNCREGNFCNDQDRCQADLCEDNNVSCDDGGECHPATGECENREPCEEDSDCLDSPEHLCLDNECRLASAACGDAEGDGGCPGNQKCEVDREEATAECLEPEVCETSVDCHDGRQCAGRECLDQITCRDDLYEPNDEADEATDYFEVAQQNTLHASLCEEDTDVYTFNSEEIVDPSARGDLLVQLDVPERDRGLGEVEVELTDSKGNTETATTGPDGLDGQVLFERALGVTDHGEYTVEVTGGEDLGEAGVEYDLSVDLIPSITVDACEEAVRFDPDDARISGDTDDAESNSMGSSCLEEGESAGEVVYAFELDEPQEIQFDLQPQLEGADLSMSLRSDCTRRASEQECVDEYGEGEGESMRAVLGEGTHYLVVQAGDEGSGGPFEVTTERIYTSCADADDHCIDEDTANLCTIDGGRFESVDCSQGCNPSTGGCFPPEGDRCLDAPVIEFEDKDDLPETYEEDFDLAELRNEYEVEATPDACVPEDGDGINRTEGADMAYQIELPARTALSADVNFSNEVEGSMYLVDDCSATNESCLEGAAESRESQNQEELQYSNFSEDEDETLYLIVDTAAGQDEATADLEVTFEEVVCDPGVRQCNDSENAEECLEDGTAFETADECDDVPCADGYCRTGETCNEAIQLDEGEVDFQYFDGGNEIDPEASGDYGSCEWYGTDDTEGHDYVYEIELEADQVLTANYNEPSEDRDANGSSSALMYLMTDCGQSDSCQTNTVSGSDGSLNYVATEDETVYVVVDRTFGDSSDTLGYEFDYEIGDDPECYPEDDDPVCLGEDEREYCDGGYWETEQCTACDSGECPDGQNCSDAIPMDDGDSDSQMLDGENNIDPQSVSDTPGDCDFTDGFLTDSTDGHEAIYEVDLEADEILTAEYEDAATTTLMYILSDCQDESSCQANTASESSGKLHYRADDDETVYVVMDRSGSDPDSTEYNLDVSITEAECTPGDDAPQCADSETLEHCVEPGLWEDYDCAGGCSDGACGEPTGEVCYDPIPMEDGDTDQQSFDGGNNVDPVGDDETGSCDFVDDSGFYDVDLETSGEEYVYSVDLEDGDVLDASYSGGDDCFSGAYDAVMYILEDCGDGNTCQDYDYGGSGSLTYVADKDETVFVVMDFNGEFSSSYCYDFEVDIQ
ncbi:MAG: hypothetical protein ACOCV2_00440 [Persicimonas sp.]